MKTLSKIAALGLTASVLAMASTANAAVSGATGTINVTGSVGPKCMVSPSAASTFSGTLAFGELSTNSAGTLSPSVVSSSVSFEVLCNTSTPTVTISATPMTAQNNPTTATGYSSTVDYTAEAAVQKATSGTATFSFKTADSSSLSNEPSTGPVGDRLKATAQNLTVTASSLTTRGGADQVLVADTSYAGVITVTVSPS